MSNFKSGSGNLDFGDGDEDAEAETTTEMSQTETEVSEDTESTASEPSLAGVPNGQSADTENTADRSETDSASMDESTTAGPTPDRYPYFVRRSNVGDERDTRLEIHVRDKVADREAVFRNELAEHLDANEIAKTDAREFALLAAFQNPERVAELMRDEGFGTLE